MNTPLLVWYMLAPMFISGSDSKDVGCGNVPVVPVLLLPLQQGDRKFASFAWLAFHIQHAIVLKNYLTGDGKSDAEAAV